MMDILIQFAWIGVTVCWAGLFGFRQRWGCRFGMHRYRAAFPATYFHGECVKCGKRTIHDPGPYRRKAPIDQRWLETGIKTVLKPPPPNGRLFATKPHDDGNGSIG